MKFIAVKSGNSDKIIDRLTCNHKTKTNKESTSTRLNNQVYFN